MKRPRKTAAADAWAALPAPWREEVYADLRYDVLGGALGQTKVRTTALQLAMAVLREAARPALKTADPKAQAVMTRTPGKRRGKR